jgi:hypothetical protein
VDLEDQPAGHRGLFQGRLDADQGDLEDVGGQALDAGVHGLALARLADAEVGRRQLGDLAAPPEQRLGVAPLAGLGDRAVHVVAHRREGLEVGGQDELPPPRWGC